ncbi:MAG: hypothetical protein ACT4OO_10450, partial [Nitrospiraceae bacterium]
VVICLTWAMVVVVRQSAGAKAIWIQTGALSFYLLAAASAMASERGGMSAHVHRPFSLLTQLCLALAVVYYWKAPHRRLMWLNGTAWAAILADTALHYILAR